MAYFRHLELGLRLSLLSAAPLRMAAESGGSSSGHADATVVLPPYVVAAPKFNDRFEEFLEKVDNLGGTTWLGGIGAELSQAIIWRHKYLQLHPNERATIVIESAKDGRVDAATTVYTSNGRVYASSYALGAHQKLSGLNRDDINDRLKLVRAIDDISETYELAASMAMADFRSGTRVEPVEGILIAAATPRFWRKYGPIPSEGSLPFYGGMNGGALVPAQWTYSFDDGGPPTYQGPWIENMDSIYRELHDPGQAGLIPVAISPMTSEVQTPQGIRHKIDQAIVFDWDGVHYVYRPRGGTIGHPIPRNPVTRLPYLCVKDTGLLESIYFVATYLHENPRETALVIPSDRPSAAFSQHGTLCLFIPALNQFVVFKKQTLGAFSNMKELQEFADKTEKLVIRRLLGHSVFGVGRLSPVPTSLPGDTPDMQMRRVFVAFQNAGIMAKLESSRAPIIEFRWNGLRYRYNSRQELAVVDW